MKSVSKRTTNHNAWMWFLGRIFIIYKVGLSLGKFQWHVRTAYISESTPPRVAIKNSGRPWPIMSVPTVAFSIVLGQCTVQYRFVYFFFIHILVRKVFLFKMDRVIFFFIKMAKRMRKSEYHFAAPKHGVKTNNRKRVQDSNLFVLHHNNPSPPHDKHAFCLLRSSEMIQKHLTETD